MNNLQYSLGKFVSPPTTVANRNEVYGHDDKKTRTGNESRQTGALKIFYESRNFNTEESRHEWNFLNTRKKSSRVSAHRTNAEARKKTRKNEKKTKTEEDTKDEAVSRPGFVVDAASKAKARGTNSKTMHRPESIFSQYALQKTDWAKNREISEKYVLQIESERPPASNLFTLPVKKAEEKKSEKVEVTVNTRGFPFPTANKSLSRKTSEKVTSKPSEMKASISDSGKRRINEILKNHAQKVQSTPGKTIQIKDYSINALDTHKKSTKLPVTPGEEIKDPKESKEPKQHKEPKEPLAKSTSKSEKAAEVKQETASVNKMVEIDFKVIKEEKKEKSKSEDKKIPGVWLKIPQSNELERRLRNSWDIPVDNKEPKTDKKVEDEQTSENTSEKDDSSKSEKRVTYTDRLLLLKMLGKNLEEKKQKAGQVEAQSKEQKERKPTEKELVVQVESKPTIMAPKDIATEESKSCASLKEGKFLETENVYKTKQTRSTELRDLVSQAIKEHKIFCIFDNHTYIVRPVREELLSRGWLEVIPDRRLIPRRRPPPMGPVYERDKSITERNCNTLEAILAARETFADEIQDTVSKSSFRFVIEKPVLISSSGLASKKSEESLTEALSQFRIIPPTLEKKKNNFEIREFVAKYQAYVDKEKERENEIKMLREKEKNSKTNHNKKEKVKTPVLTFQWSRQAEKQPAPEANSLGSGSQSLQEIWDSIKDNKKIIIQATTEIKNIVDAIPVGKTPIASLYDTTQKVPAIENKPEQNKSNNTNITSNNTNNSSNNNKDSNSNGENSQQKTKGVNSTAKCVFTDAETKAISKIIQSSNARIQFMWLSIKPGIHLKCFNYSPEIVNKFQKTTFCTKIGLWSHLNNMQWYAHEVNYPAKSPRMYNTGEADDMQAFFQDFQLTACIGMLKWLADTFFEKGLKAVQTKRGKVPLKAFEFAIKQCEKYMRFKENEELNLPEEPTIHQEEWNTFLQWFYIITNDHGKVQESSSAQLMVVYTRAVETLKMMKRHWPEMDIDGRLNIWIMKPYCASCGRGIFMTNNVYYISQHSKYIVQKYIEKPLLIYNTKFDIRQWFMITKLTPLEIWMYKECYLRFCSQPFALRNLHESVHLSNNSVQRKYISLRDPNLPDQNMWDSNTFRLYLRTIGHPNAWEEIIYPGMRDAIVSTMLAAQDTFDGPRKSWFEVYGADFMLSANLKEGPWLIEINENPAMDPSTKITARLCPQMLRDVIKVVVDKRANKNANTGQWELIYRQNYSPSFGTVDLDVRGKKIARVPYATKLSFSVSPNNTKQRHQESMVSKEQEKMVSSRVYEFVKCLGASKKSKKSSFEKLAES